MEELYEKQRKKEEAATKFEEERRREASAKESAKAARDSEKRLLLHTKVLQEAAKAEVCPCCVHSCCMTATNARAQGQ
jgi:hypothetical protein